jgi:hypothetical protein
MRYWRTFLGMTVAATVIGLAAPATISAATPTAPKAAVGRAVAAAPYCGITWGSLLKAHASTAVAPLTNVRAGRHPGFDRLVFDLAGPVDGYHVAYVAEVTEDGSGRVIALRGGARLQIIVVGPAHDDNYQPTYRPANRRELVAVTGWSTFRQVAWAGSFEGQTTVGLGVRARLPFRVFTLDGPGAGSRLVVDVAHRW